MGKKRFERGEIVRETAQLTPDEIGKVCGDVLDFARERIGEGVNARAIDLRLWMAAMLIHSANQVSIETEIRASFETKLKFLGISQTKTEDQLADDLGLLH